MTRLFQAKPFIICEIGSNFRDYGEANEAVSKAKQAGAHAVKFQLFTKESLYAVEPEGELRTLHPPWLPKLKEKANACGIEFMCSAFSPDEYEVVDPLVEVHKIASSEMNDPHILHKVRSFGKPILMSVGGSNKGDIEQAMTILRGGPQVVLMYCVSSYPAYSSNLFMMKDLADTFKVPVGLSDHSCEVIYPPLSAVRHFGAVAVEKHVEFNCDSTSPDFAHSLSGDDFKLMCDYLYGTRNPDEFQPQKEEQPAFVMHNRRLIATKRILPGERFEYGRNFGSFRSTVYDIKGFSPMLYSWVAERNAAKQIEPGESIGPAEVAN